jgi:hypothetical protein
MSELHGPLSDFPEGILFFAKPPLNKFALVISKMGFQQPLVSVNISSVRK